MPLMDVLAASLLCNEAHFLCSFCTALQVSYRILEKLWNVACMDLLAMFSVFLLILFSTASGSK